MFITFDSVCRTLETVRSVSGSKAKTAILKAADSPLLREVLSRAYDPSLTYGVTSKTAYDVGGYGPTPLDHSAIFALLDDLAKRVLTGQWALECLADNMSGHTALAQKTILGILDKHLDCGISEKTINSAFPGLIPEPPVMLAQTFELKRAKWPMLAQTKMDGMRVFTEVRNGRVIKRSRNWHGQNKFMHIDAAFAEYNLPDGYYDGELMYPRFGSRAIESDKMLVLYDYLTPAEFDNRASINQMGRTARLMEISQQILPACLGFTDSRIVGSYEEAQSFYNEIVAAGGEGIMLKDMNAPYAFRRSYAWLKMKPVKDIDLEIVGLFEGEGKYKGQMGGIIVDYNGKHVRVGSGFTDEQRLRASRAPAWVSIGRTAEIRYTDTTPDGSLLFPRFVRIREDK